MGEVARPQDLRTALRSLTARVRALESGRRLDNASIGATGVFQAGATTTGAPVLYLGTLNTVGGGGMEVRRHDGSLALRVGKTDPGDLGQGVTLFDKAGNPAVQDSVTIADGFARPSMALGMRPVNSTLDVIVSTTVWTDVFEVTGRKFNAAVEGRFQALCADGTTAAEARLVDAVTGLPLPTWDSNAQDPTPIPVGTTAMTRFVTGACSYLGVVHATVMQIRVQVRRTAGSGTVTVRAGVVCGAA